MTSSRTFFEGCPYPTQLLIKRIFFMLSGVDITKAQLFTSFSPSSFNIFQAYGEVFLDSFILTTSNKTSICTLQSFASLKLWTSVVLWLQWLLNTSLTLLQCTKFLYCFMQLEVKTSGKRTLVPPASLSLSSFFFCLP